MTEKLVAITAALLPPPPSYDTALDCYHGEPWTQREDGKYVYKTSASEAPYVHLADIIMPDQTGRVSRSGKPLNLLIAHGGADSDGVWIFNDGRSVIEFIDAYNSSNPRDIDVASVCNPTPEKHPTTQHSVSRHICSLGLREGDKTVVNIAPKGCISDFMMYVCGVEDLETEVYHRL
jgi:hypothetical protein